MLSHGWRCAIGELSEPILRRLGVWDIERRELPPRETDEERWATSDLLGNHIGGLPRGLMGMVADHF